MGPLTGKTIIEFAGLGPGPYAGMMLADMGAKVVRVERPGGQMMTAGVNPKYDIHNRGKNCICINMKSAEGIACAIKLIGTADALIEGYRPGVMEKLGLGPDVCLEINPKLVYGRMTGWGQTGPLANAAGHDINYIALTGVLHAIGRKGEKPAIPLNVVGDYGGGGMMLAFGLVCALLETQQSGQGQVVDCSIVDGVASLMGFFYSQLQAGIGSDERGGNMLDSGAFFYDVYETSDGKYVSIGSIEPQFFKELVTLLELSESESAEWMQNQWATKTWPQMADKLEALIKTKTRDAWCDIFEGSDVCFAPVLSMAEARKHPHNVARETFVDDGDVWEPAPVPRFSRTNAEAGFRPVGIGADSQAILLEIGYKQDEIDALLDNGAIA
jgi:alpha-methylacyl-CoA racemase